MKKLIVVLGLFLVGCENQTPGYDRDIIQKVENVSNDNISRWTRYNRKAGDIRSTEYRYKITLQYDNMVFYTDSLFHPGDTIILSKVKK
jgi:hypothetical protein